MVDEFRFLVSSPVSQILSFSLIGISDPDNIFLLFNGLAKPKEFLERTIGFTINYAREDPNDPRELSEFPDIRLWFLRLDATYPWLPVLLDWRAGELARYSAMLVPHQVIKMSKERERQSEISKT